MDRQLAANYVGENFQPSDRLAVVLLNKRGGSVTQRIAIAERIASSEFQAWLRHKNADKHEIYISMNTLRPHASGRTKKDIETVRHLYLDFDDHGTEAVGRLLERQDLPRPSYRINSSPGKWQVTWKVESFEPQQAERLQKFLARETGADPAATDSSRVLRLPGFYNHKYDTPHFVTVDKLSDRVFRSDDFSRLYGRDDGRPLNNASTRRIRPRDTFSQSERDWAYAKRALARGDAEEVVIAKIAVHRRYDKHDPQYYAQLTVKNARASLNDERDLSRSLGDR
jgi:RepB DNA-primase from phage plasmid